MMIIMGSSKNHHHKKNNKWCFLLCFRPNILEESFKPIKGSQEGKIFLTFSNDQKKTDGSKSPLRRFPRVMKAIFSNSTSSSTKKKRNKKSEKEISRSSSDSNISSKFQKIFDTSCEKKSKSILSSSSSSYKLDSSAENSVSSRSSLFSTTSTSSGSSMHFSSSSSSISSMVSSSRTGSESKQSGSVDLKELKPNNKPPIVPSSSPPPPPAMKKKENGSFNTDIGLYFVLICLVGLIFSGKAFAIFCTSTCLFLIPPLSSKEASSSSEETDVDSIIDDVDSDGYKKKIIMEGLLERNRTRML
ncbi:hypothetical protein M9H77_14890 [Catharanthus roseus]|uniref:Uncharacterized protein n=1 Tax=Catharanthus roseus TaxID=4058 RepID=A0ACC0BPE4_CATRO|nr:hypothetical protein M9H77_14890 [Catharanthus roseus]